MSARKFRIVYILPSRYDDEGYVHRYVWGVLPSNTLTCLRSLTLDVAKRGTLGADVEVSVEVFDDQVHRIRPERIIESARRDGAKLLVGMVGVQSNQFPRAGDIALAFREHDVPVMLGGFHVSGVMAMFNEPDRDMRRLMERGVTMVSGEVEAPGTLDGILRDALNDSLQPIYRVTETPSIMEAAVPAPEPAYLKRFLGRMGTIDTSRGCPFNCSFCTIINVQGRKMRHRSAECMLETIREHYAHGIIYYFFTDDNFSRSPVWPELFDGLKQLRAEGIDVQFMMQVDTQAWRIKGFIERAKEAGCVCVFIGMETINEKNLIDADKRQNKVHQYAEMVEAWHKSGMLVHVGFIIGFPHDTPESIRGDLAMLRDQIKVDEASFFMLTPLPGSRDHLDMIKKGVPLDADLNNYDSFHETFRHANIEPGDWYKLYVEAWDTFYAKEHVTNVLLRCPTERYWRMFWWAVWNRYADLNRSHSMITGFLRRKSRGERRPTFPGETRAAFARRRVKDIARETRTIAKMFFEYQEIFFLTYRRNDPIGVVLAELRDIWFETKQRIEAMDIPTQTDQAAEWLRATLRVVANRFGELSVNALTGTENVRRRLDTITGEARGYLASLEDPTEENIQRAKAYIRDTVLPVYEALLFRNVGRCRRVNAYREEMGARYRSGGLLNLGFWARAPRAIVDQAVLGARFMYTFLYSTLYRRLRVA